MLLSFIAVELEERGFCWMWLKVFENKQSCVVISDSNGGHNSANKEEGTWLQRSQPNNLSEGK